METVLMIGFLVGLGGLAWALFGLMTGPRE